MFYTHLKATAVALLALGTVCANAGFHNDLDLINVELNATTPSFTGTFDITGPGPGKGYDPSSMNLTSAFATFTLYDPVMFGGSESATVDLGGNAFSSVGPFLGVVLLGDTVLGSALFDLGQDGVISYTVTRGSGSFTLLAAELNAESAEGSSRRQAVPDAGGTFAALGLGLLGVGAFRTKAGRRIFEV